jgi:hypothetical protein
VAGSEGHCDEPFVSVKCIEFLDKWSDYCLLKLYSIE